MGQVKSSGEEGSERVEDEIEDEFPLTKEEENIMLQALQEVDDREGDAK